MCTILCSRSSGLLIRITATKRSHFKLLNNRKKAMLNLNSKHRWKTSLWSFFFLTDEFSVFKTEKWPGSDAENNWVKPLEPLLDFLSLSTTKKTFGAQHPIKVKYAIKQNDQRYINSLSYSKLPEACIWF